MFSLGIEITEKCYESAILSRKTLCTLAVGKAINGCKKMASKCYFQNTDFNDCNTFDPFTRILVNLAINLSSLNRCVV